MRVWFVIDKLDDHSTMRIVLVIQHLDDISFQFCAVLVDIDDVTFRRTLFNKLLNFC